MRSSLILLSAAATMASALPAAAGGPTHLIASSALAPQARYAIAPSLDAGAAKALTEGLRNAGLKVAPASEPHDFVVKVTVQAHPICTYTCSLLVKHDDARLDDYVRRYAVVVAQAGDGESVDPARPIAWYTVLQSDGLSARTADYLPGLLRYGAKGYGRTVAGEAPPRLNPGLRLPPPNPTISPG